MAGWDNLDRRSTRRALDLLEETLHQVFDLDLRTDQHTP
jgi:hypothetical protein